MDAVIGGQQRIVVSDVQAVGAVVAEQALAERAHIVAVAVKDHDRLSAPGQHEYVVVGVHGHAGAFLEIHAVGQLGPVLDEFVTEIAFAVYFWHFQHPFVADFAGYALTLTLSKGEREP